MLEGPAGTGKTSVALQVANNLMESANDTCGEADNEPLLVLAACAQDEYAPIMKYMDVRTRTRANKIFKHWRDLLEEFGLSGSDEMLFLHLAEALAKKWEGRQIVVLVDEIIEKDMLNKLEVKSLPESVRMILILNPVSRRMNPDASGSPLTLPPSFLHVTLTTPYRSTIAITSLARFMAKCEGLVLPDSVDFGSDVEGTKPIAFDIGSDERQMEKALEECHKQLGDNATILYDTYTHLRPIENWMKATGAHWDRYDAHNFYGWEADTVIAVLSTQGSLMELLTRAKTKLYILLVDYDDNVVDSDDSDYDDDGHYQMCATIRGYFYQAAEQGLVEMKII